MTHPMAAAKAAELAGVLVDAGGEIVEGIDIEPVLRSGDFFAHEADAAKTFPSGAGVQEGILVVSTNPDAKVDVVIVQDEESGLVQLGFADEFSGGDKLTGLGRKSLMGGPARHPLGFFPVATRGELEFKTMGVAPRFVWKLIAALRIPTGVAEKIARAVEGRLKPDPGWIAMADGYTSRVGSTRLEQARGQRVLLFVHGIFSSISGAFSGLGAPAGTSTLATLASKYGGNVFGYDHWTIAKTPLENAIELLEAIPPGSNWDIDLVCHSRGGLITRTLLANPDDAAHLRVPELRKIKQLREGRIASVRTVVFAAGASQGSPLANPDKIRKFFKIVTVLASRSPGFALDAVIGLLRAVLSAGYELPSIRQLDGETSALISELNDTPSLLDDPAARAFAIRAIFDPSGWDWKQGAAAIEAYLMPEPNDLVVPYDGVVANPAIPKDRQKNYSPAQSKVWHTEYFEQGDTHRFLLQHLEADAEAGVA